MKMITDNYKDQNTKLHAELVGYGMKGHKVDKMVAQLASSMKVTNFLDYGAGKCTLAQMLPQFVVDCYDPAIPGLDEPPEPHRLVVCTDVLEHIEPECLKEVLEDLHRVTLETLFVTIHLGESLKTLPDGRGTHLIIQPLWAWLRDLEPYFDLVTIGKHNFTCTGVFRRVDASESFVVQP